MLPLEGLGGHSNLQSCTLILALVDETPFFLSIAGQHSPTKKDIRTGKNSGTCGRPFVERLNDFGPDAAATVAVQEGGLGNGVVADDAEGVVLGGGTEGASAIGES